MPRKKNEEENLSDLSIDELIERRRQIMELLSSLEDDYRNAEISEDSYKEAKEKNARKLGQLNEIIKDWGITDDQLEEQPSKQKDSKEKAPAEAEKEQPEESVKTEKADKKAGDKKPQKPEIEEQPEERATVYTPPQAGVSMEVIEAKMDAKVEKVNANVDAMKEANTGLSERMQNLNETIGELRLQSNQNENFIKDLQSKLETLQDQISEIDPRKFTRELEKRDSVSSQQDMRIEKIEVKGEQISKTVGDVRKLLESIGGLENIAAVSKEIAKKMSLINKTYDDTAKLSSKIERMYVNLNKRMEDFAVYQSKQENMEELIKDIVKSFDTLNVRMDNYVPLSSFDEMKKNLSDLELKINELGNMIGKVIPIARTKLPKTITDLQEEKEAVQSLLESIESERTKGEAGKESYENVRSKNMEKLKKIESSLQKEWSRFERMVTGAPKAEPPEEPEPKEKTGAEATEESKPRGETEESKESEGAEAEAEVAVEEEQAEKPKSIKKPAKRAAIKTSSKASKAPVKTKKAKKAKPAAKSKLSANTKTAKTKKVALKKQQPVKVKRSIAIPVKTAAKEAAKKEDLMTERMAKFMKTGKIESIKDGQEKTEPYEEAESGSQSQKIKDNRNPADAAEASSDDAKKKATAEKQAMIAALEDSYKRGLLSKEAFERAKKMI